ncbi:hypothetical protein WSM22_05080 [Cytophagales bacterium WSM2-2]|nr:hypothetical protein WSM22_05080 [Cytophagales bacterium WSM2-2]
MEGHLSAQIKTSSLDSLLIFLKNHPEHDTTHVQILNRMAYLNYYSDPLATFKYGWEAKRISDSIHFSKGQAEANRQIGLSYWEQGNIPNALNYYLIGLRIAEAGGFKQIEADITGNIGTAYNNMGNPKEAMNFLNRALAMQQQLNNKLRESAVLNNIGDSYVRLHEYDKAFNAYLTGYRYSVRNDFKLGATTNLRNLGNVLELKGKYDSALINYYKSIMLSSEIHDFRGFVLSHKSIASVYLKTRKIAQAKEHVEIALQVALKAKQRANIRDLYELMYQISEASNDDKRSFDYFKLFTAYKDSVQDLKVVSAVASQRLQFETDKKQSEIELLKKDRKIQSERISNKNYQLVFGVTLSMLVILFLGLSLRGYRNVKVKNSELNEKNNEVYEQHLALSTHRDEMLSLNEELQSQREEMMAQRDAMAEKNQEIESINQKITKVNENLEHLVALRTNTLEAQNRKLADYAFLNAHKLRAPLARIMGLANLLKMKNDPKEKVVIMTHLVNSTEELDMVVNELTGSLQRELNSQKRTDKNTVKH